jgi:hypothetical protein
VCSALLSFLLNYFSAKYDRRHASNDSNTISSSFPIASPSAIDVDPFQTVDPFASQSDIGSSANNEWYQPSTNGASTNDPFPSKAEIPPKNKTIPSKPNIKQTPAADPWGGSTNTNNGNGWAAFNNTSSPFSTAQEWPQAPSNGNSSSG